MTALEKLKALVVRLSTHTGTRGTIGRELAALIPALEREMQALVASKITEFGTLKQAAVENEREACAQMLIREVERHRKDNPPHEFCEDYGCSSLEEFAAKIRSRGSHDALDKMLTEAYERGRKDAAHLFRITSMSL